jgi:hypothetical protein
MTDGRFGQCVMIGAFWMASRAREADSIGSESALFTTNIHIVCINLSKIFLFKVITISDQFAYLAWQHEHFVSLRASALSVLYLSLPQILDLSVGAR